MAVAASPGGNRPHRTLQCIRLPSWKARKPSALRRHLIFRTSWVYAARGGNFARTMLRLAQERERLTVVDDQIGAPTGADLLADVTAHAIRMALQQAELSGLYHLVAGGETSWHGYACYVLHLARQAGIELKVAGGKRYPGANQRISVARQAPPRIRVWTPANCKRLSMCVCRCGKLVSRAWWKRFWRMVSRKS